MSNKNRACLLLIMTVLFNQISFINAQEVNRGKILDPYFVEYSGNTPGAVVSVIKEGEMMFTKAYGLTDINSQEKVNNKTVFNLTGINKSFTALAVLQLVEKRKISLDNTLTDLFPGFPVYGSAVKVEHLLSNTSGLKNYNSDKVGNNSDVFEYLKSQDKTSFESGTKWGYSNSDYPMLVNIIEKISNLTYEEYLTKNIFNKLSIENVSFPGYTNVLDIAKGHIKKDGIYLVSDKESNILGEQGVYMNVLDFAKWDNVLYTDKLLSCENLSKIFSIYKLPSGQKEHSYGFGWVLMEKNGIRYYWHSGTGLGYSNIVLHLPDTKTTIIILTNREDSPGLLRLSIKVAKEFDKELRL